MLELALCLPLLFVIIFGSIEACNMITLKQITTQAAYEGTLAAVQPTAVEADVVSSVSTVLSVRNVTPQAITVAGPLGEAYSTLHHGDTLVITVTATVDNNAIGPQLFGSGRVVEAKATGVKQ